MTRSSAGKTSSRFLMIAWNMLNIYLGVSLLEEISVFLRWIIMVFVAGMAKGSIRDQTGLLISDKMFEFKS